MIPAADHSIAMREAVVTKLLATGAIAVLVGTRVRGPAVEDGIDWPFIRYGLPITNPMEQQGRAGSAHAITVHVFAKGEDDGPVGALAAAVVAALNDTSLPVEPLGLLGIDWTGTQVIRDDAEASAYHGIIQFRAETFAE